MMDAQAITIWAFADAPADLRSLAKTDKPAWLALIPRTYADYHDLFWLDHIDVLHDPERYPHPSLSEYKIWIGRHG